MRLRICACEKQLEKCSISKELSAMLVTVQHLFAVPAS